LGGAEQDLNCRGDCRTIRCSERLVPATGAGFSLCPPSEAIPCASYLDVARSVSSLRFLAPAVAQKRSTRWRINRNVVESITIRYR
jgi:hypothetical protein